MNSSILDDYFDVFDLPVPKPRQIIVDVTTATPPPVSSVVHSSSGNMISLACTNADDRNSEHEPSFRLSRSRSEVSEGTPVINVDTTRIEDEITTALDEQGLKFHEKINCRCTLDNDSSQVKNEFAKEVLHYRVLEANKRERARCLDEGRDMKWEDIRSALLRRRITEEEAYEKSIDQNRRKISELRKDREEDSINELHESVALARAQARERLRQSIDRVKVRNGENQRSIKKHPILLADISHLDNYCKNILRDFLRCREQMIAAKGKLETIQLKINAFSTESRILDRAVQMLVIKIYSSKKPSMESSQDFCLLCKERDCKQSKLSEVKAVLLEQQEQLSDANREVQDLRVLCNEKADYLSKLLEALTAMEKQTRLKLSLLHKRRESTVPEKTNKMQRYCRPNLDEVENRAVLNVANEESKLGNELCALSRAKDFLSKRWERLRRTERSIFIPIVESSDSERSVVGVESSKCEGYSLAHDVRGKQQSVLSIEEKKWIGMDFRINRNLYTECKYIHEIEGNTEYCISNIDEDDVRRILSFPDQIQMALPFLRSHSEVEAHKTLMHYTRGKGESFFKLLDWKSSTDQNSVAESRVFTDINELASEKSCSNHNSHVFITSDTSRQIMKEANLCLGRKERRIHNFEVFQEDKQVNLALTIVIVFHGQFLESGIYQSGKISASLSRIPSSANKCRESIRLGFAPYNLQELNSKDSFGRLVIIHQPMKEIQPGVFEVLIQNESLVTNYSIKVDLNAGHDAMTVLEKEYRSHLLKQSQSNLLQTEVDDIQTTIRLTDRKLFVMKSLLDDSTSESRRCRAEMETCEDALDETMEDLSDYHFDGLPRKISLLELEFLHWSKLSNMREQELRNMKAKVNQLSKMKRDRLTMASKLHAETDSGETLIVRAMEAIIGPEITDSQITKINEEYELGNKVANATESCNQLKGDMELDIDVRCRQILTELNKAANNACRYMDSSVLHAAPQRFPTKVIRIDLERELDRILTEEIFRRERAQPFLETDRSYKNVTKAEPPCSQETVCDTINGRRKQALTARKQRRSKAKIVRGQTHCEVNRIESEIQEKKKLGFGGCLACKQNGCAWVATETDMAHLIERKEDLSNELFSISKSEDQSLCSTVAASAMRGGGTRFRRLDLIDELTKERTDIECRLSLYEVDKELHDSFASTKPYVEVKSLHGYNTLLSTPDARLALQREHNRLVATSVGTEIVDDILKWMLDGWYFGERESLECAVGYIPSYKNDGPVRAGIESMKAFSILKKRTRHSSKFADDTRRGTEEEKINPILEKAQTRLAKENSKIETDHRRDVLNTAEQTTKFGLFCITFMYFRAMYLVSAEKDSWSGRNDILVLNKSKHDFSEERARMIQEGHNVAERKAKMDYAMSRARIGEERKRKRAEEERSRVIREFHKNMRCAKKEKMSTLTIQRIFRGYLGRKDAENWAKERAAMEALQALQKASAITIARIWRGTVGRRRAKSIRNSMIEFIANIRAEEVVQDEQDYWEQNRWFGRLRMHIPKS